MRRRIVLMTLSVALLPLACGVPDSGNVSIVEPGDVPFGLSETTTTTTTTTLPPTTTAPPPLETTTTIAAVEESTTTTLSIELVDIYFPSGSTALGVLSLPIAQNPVPNQVMARLLQGPGSDTGATSGLGSILPKNADITVVPKSGVAEVDLPVGLFDTITDGNRQLLVFGQLVMTMTSQRGIGQVRIRMGGEPYQVLLGDGSAAEPDQLLTAADYVNLVTTGITPGTTTTSTTTPVTITPDAAATSEATQPG